MTKMSQISKRLVECLNCLKVTPKELDKATGIGLRNSYRIMNEGVPPKVETLAKIKIAFPKVPIIYILIGSCDKKKAV